MSLQISDEEFEQQYRMGVKRGQARLKKDPHAISARYDRRSGRVVIELTNGSAFMFPAELAQGLRGAAPKDLAEIEVMPYGLALRWPRLDADFTVAGLLAGIFGSKAWMAEMGRQGGSTTSAAKTAAARANGRKGGRPPARRPNRLAS